jgi:hypothetical protein
VKAPTERSSIVVSVAVHIALAAIILPLALGSSTVAAWLSFGPKSQSSVRQERIQFVKQAPPKKTSVANGTDAVSGGEAAPASAPLIAPAVTPDFIPDPVAAPKASADGTNESARGDGSGGPLVGIRPSFSDSRLWVIPGPGPGEGAITPAMMKARIDSLIREGLIPKSYEDSLRRVVAAMGMHQGSSDWTIKGPNGEKWGMDGGYIRLGKFSIPTVLLALLPLNLGGAQANALQNEEARRIGRMTADIQYQAQKAMNDDEFSAAVARVRKRKDAERQEIMKRKDAEAKEAAAQVIPGPVSPVPVIP